ncbi:UDP-glycosyltransferase 73C6 [Spatholobus suberectus]|nr:UDP-glycosyltransferase 73C6 [Spatholobus suberectus]
MSSEAPKLNFVLFPLMSQGHMIPMMDIAKILAQQGVSVTVITTHHNASRFTATFARSIDSGSQIKLVELQFPYQEAGLPDGCENLDMLPSLGTGLSLFNAANSNTLKEQVEKLFEELTPPPSCIISDMCLPYTANIAGKFNIPRISFVGQSCFSLFCLYNLGIHRVLSGITSETEYFVLPGTRPFDIFLVYFGTEIRAALSMLEELLEKLNPFPCCIISDKYMPCVADIAIKFKVPRIVFDGTNCLNLLCNHNLHGYKVYETVSDSDHIIVLGLPHRIEMRKSHLPLIFRA